MNFEKLVNNSLGTLFNQFAKDCEYVRGDEKYTVKGVFKDLSVDVEGSYKGTQIIVEKTTIEIRAKDLPIDPQYGDQIRINNRLYIVVTSMIDEYGVCLIELGASNVS
jgi:hypothetical protein